MLNTYLIGKHLNPQRGELLTESCCLCHRDPDGKVTGFPRQEVVSNTFMDVCYLHFTNVICEYCAACLGYGKPRTEHIKNYSYIANENSLVRLKREDIWGCLFNPPETPFIFCVTYNHKKHTSFKASVNYSREHYAVCTENELIEVRPAAIRELAQVIQDWYTICKDTTQAPTWFTKAEILQGCDNFKRIEEYGTAKYFQQEAVITPYRCTPLLGLLVHALNKAPMRETAHQTNERQ